MNSLKIITNLSSISRACVGSEQYIRSFHSTCKLCRPSYRPAPASVKPPSLKPSFKEPNKGGPNYILLAIPALTFCLGTWQVQRRKWKLALIQDMTQRTAAPPIPYPQDLSLVDDLEYRSVRVRGTFDHSREIHMAPRAPINEERPGGGGLISMKSKVGAFVITPFKLADRDLTILVNRGWVPREAQDPRARVAGQVGGEVELCGVVRLKEKRPPFGGKNNPERNMWFNRDVDAMAEILGTDPYFIEADMRSTVPGGPVGGQTRVTLRNEHGSYIITWYTLTAITLYYWYTWFGKAARVVR